MFHVFGKARAAAEAAPVETKASATLRVVSWAGTGRVAWSARDTATLTRAGFLDNPIGFRAVKLIAEAAAAVPLVVQDKDRRYDTHPFADLLDRPNGTGGRAALFEAIYGQLLLSGNAFVEAVADEGLPVELHVLRADRMHVVPGADGWPVAYEYHVGGRKHRFATSPDQSPICHIKAFHPQDDHYGFSPLQSGMQVRVKSDLSR